MAETKGPSAISAYKAGLKEGKGNRGKKRNVFYFPIGRTITTIGGVLSMINAGNVKRGIDALWDGRWNEAAARLGAIFEGGDIKKGASTIASGIILGKALDATKTNPHLKMGGYGVKLV